MSRKGMIFYLKKGRGRIYEFFPILIVNLIFNYSVQLRKNPEFKEFMALHEDRKSKPLWADDIGAVENDDSPESSDDEDTSQKGLLSVLLS